jgi:hypothetical protein
VSKAYVPWDKETWERTKKQIKELEDDYQMNNSEVQDKLLEIVRRE